MDNSKESLGLYKIGYRRGQEDIFWGPLVSRLVAALLVDNLRAMGFYAVAVEYPLLVSTGGK